MSEDLRLIDLLRSLDRHGVRYVIIGGVAVGLHGYARATKDLDVIIEPSAENIERLWAFIEDVDAEPLAIGDFDARELPLPFEPQSILEGGGNWLLQTRFGRIDIMQYAEGAPSMPSSRPRAIWAISKGCRHRCASAACVISFP